MEITILDDKYKRLDDILHFLREIEGCETVTMKTQYRIMRYANHSTQEHVFTTDAEIIVKKDRMIILQEHTCSVIDLRNEMPYEVTVKHA